MYDSETFEGRPRIEIFKNVTIMEKINGRQTHFGKRIYECSLAMQDPVDQKRCALDGQALLGALKTLTLKDIILYHNMLYYTVLYSSMHLSSYYLTLYLTIPYLLWCYCK